jgi:molecular chaperone GrpE
MDKEPMPATEPTPKGAQVSEEETLVAKLESELEEYKDKYLRQLAETENMRKRLTKEKQEMIRFGVDNIIAEILMPLDNLENALKCAQSSSAEVKNWAIGFEMILDQFKDVLSQHGVTSFSSIGEKFDPFLHEAVEVEETNEKPDGIILQEFIKGYRCGDRIIRPARVKVAKKAPS